MSEVWVVESGLCFSEGGIVRGVYRSRAAAIVACAKLIERRGELGPWRREENTDRSARWMSSPGSAFVMMTKWEVQE